MRIRLAVIAALSVFLAAGACPAPPTADAGSRTQDGGVVVVDPDAGELSDLDGGVDAGPPLTDDEVARLACEAWIAGSQNATFSAEGSARCRASDAIPDGLYAPELLEGPGLQCLPGQPIYNAFFVARTAGRVILDVEKLLACQAEGRATRASYDTWGLFPARTTTLSQAAEDDPCGSIVTSLLSEGDVCVQQWDCPTTTACEAEPLDGDQLRCLAPAEPGEGCGLGADGVWLRSCVDEAACFSGLCVYRRALGEACGADQVPCQLGLVCGPAGLCAEPLDLGGLCGSDEHCKAGAFCRAGECALEVVDGELCTPADRCRSECSVCRPDGEGATRCADRGAAGEPCSVDDHCHLGTSCQGGVCVDDGAVGVACDADRPCRAGLTCSGPIPDLPPPPDVPDGGLDGGPLDAGPPDPPPDDPTDGGPQDAGPPPDPTCRVPPPVGSACAEGDVPCLGGACVQGACVAGVEGDPCADDVDCLDGVLCVAGFCVEAPREAGLCTTDGRCAEGLTCDDGHCVGFPGPGEACAPDGSCDETAWCNELFAADGGAVGGVCVNRRAPGESCISDGQCQSGTCLITQTCAARAPSCLTDPGALSWLVLFSVGMVPVRLHRRRRRARRR